MMKPGGRISMKTTREFSLTGGGVPVDTGRLKAVFGAIDGKPNMGYIRDRAKADTKSNTTYEQDVIWERIGRYQIDMGTRLWYASVVQQKTDFTGTYLRSHEDKIQAYAQRVTNKWINKMARKHGFKGASD